MTEVSSPGDFLDIIISYIEDDGITFWAQMASGAILNQLEEIEKGLGKLSSRSRSLRLNERPVPDKIYFCCFEDGNWYRCKVIQNLPMDDAMSYLVQYIDYGNVETKLSTEIYCLDENSEYNAMPGFSHQFILHSLKVSKENALEVKMLVDEHFSDDSAKAKLHCDMSETPTKVVLYDRDMTNVNKLLVTKGLATKARPSLTPINKTTSDKCQEQDTPLNKKLEFDKPVVGENSFNNPLITSDSCESSVASPVPTKNIPISFSSLSVSDTCTSSPFLNFRIRQNPHSKPFKNMKKNRNITQPNCNQCTKTSDAMKMQSHEINKLKTDNESFERKIKDLQAQAEIPKLISQLVEDEPNKCNRKSMKEFLNFNLKDEQDLVINQNKDDRPTEDLQETFHLVKEYQQDLHKFYDICADAHAINGQYQSELIKIKQGFQVGHQPKNCASNFSSAIGRKNWLLQQFYLKINKVMAAKSSVDLDKCVNDLDRLITNYEKNSNQSLLNDVKLMSFEDLAKEFNKQMDLDKNCVEEERVKMELLDLIEKTNNTKLQTSNDDVKEYLEQSIELMKICISKIQSATPEFDLAAHLYVFCKQMKQKVVKLISDIKFFQEQQSSMNAIIELFMPEIATVNLNKECP